MQIISDSLVRSGVNLTSSHTALEEGLGSRFAMDLSKIWVLKVGLLVDDTVRGRHVDC
jgi:hypothetical protein